MVDAGTLRPHQASRTHARTYAHACASHTRTSHGTCACTQTCTRTCMPTLAHAHTFKRTRMRISATPLTLCHLLAPAPSNMFSITRTSACKRMVLVRHVHRPALPPPRMPIVTYRPIHVRRQVDSDSSVLQHGGCRHPPSCCCVRLVLLRCCVRLRSTRVALPRSTFIFCLPWALAWSLPCWCDASQSVNTVPRDIVFSLALALCCSVACWL